MVTDSQTNPTGTDTADPIPAPAVGVDRAVPAGDSSVSDLLGRLVDDLTRLFRQEVELAKTELRRDATAAGKAAGMLAGGALLGFMAVMLLLFAAAWGLAAVVPTGLAFLIVGFVVAAIAMAAAATGRKRMQSVDITPHATIESLERDKNTISERRPA